MRWAMAVGDGARRGRRRSCRTPRLTPPGGSNDALPARAEVQPLHRAAPAGGQRSRRSSTGSTPSRRRWLRQRSIGASAWSGSARTTSPGASETRNQMCRLPKSTSCRASELRPVRPPAVVPRSGDEVVERCCVVLLLEPRVDVEPRPTKSSWSHQPRGRSGVGHRRPLGGQVAANGRALARRRRGSGAPTKLLPRGQLPVEVAARRRARARRGRRYQIVRCPSGRSRSRCSCPSRVSSPKRVGTRSRTRAGRRRCGGSRRSGTCPTAKPVRSRTSARGGDR